MKLPRLIAELFDRHRAAAILDQEVETGRGAEAAESRNIERKDHAFGNRCKLSL